MTIIAEIGTSHGGSLQKAFELIDAAAEAGADCVKFQWVYADEILHPDTGFVKLPGGTVRLYSSFKSLECSPDFYSRCLEHAHDKGMLFACSPFGLRSLEQLSAIQPDAIKIASPEVNHVPLLKKCSQLYGTVPVILSSGVSRLSDIEKAVELIRGGRSISDADEEMRPDSKQPFSPLTLLHCLTFYPAPEEEYNVRCVETLRAIFGIPTGISDHSTDPVLVPVLSASLGGTIIEKHITLSRKDSGLDDPVALEPEQFAVMVHAVRQASALLERYKKEGEASGRDLSAQAQEEIFRQLSYEYTEERLCAALGSGVKKLAPAELQNYGRTNRSLHYSRSMKKGEKITEKDISVLRTEKILSPGISPEFLEELTGARLTQDVRSGDGVQWLHFLQKD